MNWQPKVSIITPSYNQAEFLGSTIRSVLRQDYPNLEYGIVDGGSRDSSIEVIREFEDRLSWWVSETDRGQSQAINKGIARSSGEIIAWLNSDDLYLPNAINEAVSSFERFDADMVFGNAIIINEHGHPLNELVFDEWDVEDLIRFRVICQPAVFMKRKVWEEVNGLDPDLHYLMDHHLWIKIAAKFSVKYIPSFWAASRYHTEAKNVAMAANFSKDTINLLNWIKDDITFAEFYSQDINRIRGGAYRLSGRYLLDGGHPGKAVRDYIQAFRYWPAFAVKHWRRIIFALVSMVIPLESGKMSKSPRREVNDVWGNLDNWPGIDLSEVRS